MPFLRNNNFHEINEIQLFLTILYGILLMVATLLHDNRFLDFFRGFLTKIFFSKNCCLFAMKILLFHSKMHSKTYFQKKFKYMGSKNKNVCDSTNAANLEKTYKIFAR